MKIFTAKDGKHAFRPLGFGLIMRDVLSGSFTITGDWVDSENPAPVHKVVGIGKLLGNHKDSVRIGFSRSPFANYDKMYSLHGYWYINGVRIIENIGPFKKDTEIKYAVSKSGEIFITTDDAKYNVRPPKGFRKLPYFSRISHPYFGGKFPYNIIEGKKRLKIVISINN